MSRVTKRDKREFILRCKALAIQTGHRINYHPARFFLEQWGLRILWQPDEAWLTIRIKMHRHHPQNERWSRVVKEDRGQPEWGYIHKIHHHLELMRREMILDDLADV